MLERLTPFVAGTDRGMAPNTGTAAGGAGASAGAARQPGLQQACREFEALLVEQVLRQARTAVPAGVTPPSFGRDVYLGWQDQILSRRISEHGGLGLADHLYRQLSGPFTAAPGADNGPDARATGGQER